MSIKALIVDDSACIRNTIKIVLLAGGIEVVGEAETGEEAIEMALTLKPDVITLDNIMPDITGLDVLKKLQEEGLASKIIMISAIGQDSVIENAITLGATKYIVKPFKPEQLIDAINQACI